MTTDSGIKLAAASDLQSFAGAELTGVTVWKFGATLAFNDEPRTITVESGAEFRSSQGRTELYNQEIIVAFGARVLSLMGRRVVGVNAEGTVLALEFDEGSVLTLRPDSSGYESYTVNLPDGSTLVGIASQ